MLTPAHIVPEWYFLPFYAILRSIPSKLGGILAMGGAIVLWLFVPALNTSRVRSTSFRPLYKLAYWFLAADFLLLGWIGQEVVYPPFILIGQLGTAFYFIYFLVLIPVIGIIETRLMKPISN
jgi:ubiquinol-cytochrome c reductase cytochrome b subunit